VSHVVQYAIIIEGSTKIITLFVIPFYYAPKFKNFIINKH